MQKLKKSALSTLHWGAGGDDHEVLMGEHACQTPCRELLVPLRGQGRGTRVDWTLLFPSSTSAEKPQPTSGGCCPSEEEDPEEEDRKEQEHALLTEISDQLFLSKKWLLKKLKNIQYGYI